ncbi:aerolysin family beta-barrel pore-forming toxin [Clostridium tarantellae]|uniref:Aerolysin family beta-barrel pore-forming toxin n=1 Tax=Clostridium tarantellae TaxID=39493 RepID=A0A6I1MM42_9CLOT|nr:aerolysin family beta-barrel pore-forming toxin [Clostridium tarantellae]MPQ44566.1 aerolysin family beta-barrel pore-forming toxin [Clostridium tarantellae]
MDNNYLLLPSSETEDKEVIKFNLVANSTFQSYWSTLAKILGFQFSETLKITKSNDDYILHEGSAPQDGKFQMIVSKFKLEFLPNSITLGIPTTAELTPDTFGSTSLNNRSSVPIKITKNFSFKVGNKISVHSSHKISNSLAIKKSSKVSIAPVTTKLELSFKFSHQYTFGNQESILEQSQFIDQATFTVPPNISVPVNVLVKKSKITTPFNALARIFYNVTFKGPFDSSKNTHRNSSAQISYTFGNDNFAAYEHLKKQYNLRHLETISPWKWDEVINQNKQEQLNFLSELFKGHAIQINGTFVKETSSDVNISAGPPFLYTTP